jgi:hypothetical protein
VEDKDPFPFIKGWWIVLDIEDDQSYEGWVIDVIGSTVIIEVEPSKIRLGLSIAEINQVNAYKQRPAS